MSIHAAWRIVLLQLNRCGHTGVPAELAMWLLASDKTLTTMCLENNTVCVRVCVHVAAR